MSAGLDTETKTIFLVEDNRADIRLIQEALKNSEAQCQVIAVRNGMEAMAYLRQEGDYAGAICPDLILLDLNLPRKDGREVLAEIKADQRLRHIPVVVLTTSSNEDDISQSYDLNVNCYITKSRNLGELFKIVQGIKDFWLGTAILPRPSARYDLG